MARSRAHEALLVLLNGRLVGQLHKSTSGAIDFQYDPSWLGWQHTFPISMSLPLREDRYAGEPVSAVFDNLLPDNVQIRRRLAERVKAKGDDAYSLLAAIGRDCVGALQFLPEGTKSSEPGRVQGEPVTDQRIATLLADLNNSPFGLSAEDTEFRISLAGAQEKTALLFWKKKWHIPHAGTATTHIFKPQIGVLGNGLDLSRSVENEHLCMRLTALLELPTAKTEIVPFGGKQVLVVERFDRQWTQDKRLLRLPQEDCCQALGVPPVGKYQSEGGPGMREILQFLKASDDARADQRLLLKAQMAFWLLAATDGHAKNFSIFIHPGGGFRLTPLYDVLSLQPNFDAQHLKRNQMKLAMSVGNSRHYVVDTILPRHFVQSAQQAGIPADVVNELMGELVAQTPKAITAAQSELPKDFPGTIAESIFGGMQRRLKLLE